VPIVEPLVQVNDAVGDGADCALDAIKELAADESATGLVDDVVDGMPPIELSDNGPEENLAADTPGAEDTAPIALFKKHARLAV